jgi:hypothetical protein
MTIAETMRPFVANLTLADADTEYSYTFTNVVGVSCQPRTDVDVRFAFVPGYVGPATSPFATMRGAAPIGFPATMIWSGTIYFASSDAGTVVEIWGWMK